jgi:hypothetical protein
MSPWYEITDIKNLDTPVLVVFPERVKHNIQTAINMVGDIKRLRPHVKTNKSAEAIMLMLEAGITQFKCATIAEAELLGMCNAPDVVLAYQPLGPKLDRFIEVIKKSSIIGLNKTQRYDTGKGFQYLDIKAILGIYFKKLNGLQKYQHFLFEASNLGTVKVQEVANGPFAEFNLLKTKKADIFEEIRALSILVLTPPPLDYKRQYLYNNIRPFVKDEYKNITCPRSFYTSNI